MNSGLTWTNSGCAGNGEGIFAFMPLHCVDPHKKHSRWYTAMESFARPRPGQWMARHVAPHVDPWLYRKTGGRYPSAVGGASTAP